VISGIPTASGPFSFTVQATDSAIPPQIVTQGYTINVVTTGPIPANVSFVNAAWKFHVGQILAGSPVIGQVTDNQGAVIPGAPVAMTFSGPPPCSAATLSGTLTQTTNAQAKPFSTIYTSIADRSVYTLLAISVNATAVSNPFTVNWILLNGRRCPTPRELHTQILLANGKVLIAGGINNTSNALNTAELYDLWRLARRLRLAIWLRLVGVRTKRVSLLPNGKVLLLGGFDIAGTPLATAELYDPATGVFSFTGSMAQARANAPAVYLGDGRILVSGGFGLSGALNSAEIYDRQQDRYTYGLT